jgi:hypothetical protein
VRYFFSRRIPHADAILLIESGSRGLMETVVPGLRQTWGADVALDLVTCYARLPEGMDPASTRVYRTTDYRGREARLRLVAELKANRYALVGLICSGEPIMTKWKWALALRLPAKVFLINENGDYFWLDRGHLGLIRQIVLLRSGLAGAGAVRTVARVVLFPFALAYLLLYAAAAHARRAIQRTTGTTAGVER